MCNTQYKTTFSVTSHCNLAVEEKYHDGNLFIIITEITVEPWLS